MLVPEFQMLLQEIIPHCIEQIVSSSQPQNPVPDIGGLEVALEVTGLEKQTIYGHTSKKTIPYDKRGGKLYFSREALLQWIKSGRRDEKKKAVKKIVNKKMGGAQNGK